MQKDRFIVIMAGGSGTRLWPLSRANLPKQFHKLASNKSLVQETYQRIKSLVPKENIYVSLVKTGVKTAQKQLPKIPKTNFIVEPEARNTAPAIALVAVNILVQNPRAIVATIASDHTIENPREFQKSIGATFQFVQKNLQYFTTLGLKPTRPETGFGYIKTSQKIPNSSFYKVESFVEKPDLKTAKRYLKSGKYFWNASYFTFQAAEILKNYQQYAPKIYRGINKISKLLKRKGSQNQIEKIYQNLPKEPFDTAIAEQAATGGKIAVIPTKLIWSDIGSWSSLYSLLSSRHRQDTISRGHHIGVSNKDCLIYASHKLLATVGLEDIIIVDTEDVTMVCHKDRAQDVKKLIEKIKEKGEDHHL